MSMRRGVAFGLLLLLLSCGMTEDENEDKKRVTYIEFSDEAFEGYLLDNYDLNADGRFSQYEAERVLYIDCSGLGVESLYGIDKFIQLRELDCSDNKISYLELNRNTQLEVVRCENNLLDLLAIDELMLLYSLDCSNNRLTGLDLRYNNALSELDCSSNRLTILDCVNCSRTMRYLDCRDNPDLEMLYLHRNQSFDEIYMDGDVVVERR